MAKVPSVRRSIVAGDVRETRTMGASIAGDRSMEREDKFSIPSAGREAEVLTIAEAALLLRCSKAHVSNLLNGKVANAQSLPHIPVGRRKLIRRESLLRWMERAEAQC